MRLTQSVTVDRSGWSAIATTWHDEHTAILSFDKTSDVFAGLDGMLDKLVRDWRAANK